jgi:hypothetical protein
MENINFKKWLLRGSLTILALLLLISIGWFTLRKPTNDRNWSLDQQILPFADFSGNLVSVHNIRNFTYKTTEEYTPGYYNKTFDLNKIKKVYYVVEPFSAIAGPAHTFLTFEFEDDNYLSISIEIRKRQGESFIELLSAINYYELMYVVADENDVVKLRSNYRHDLVFMYPMRGEKEDLQKLFVDMLQRANKLKEEPVFFQWHFSNHAPGVIKGYKSFPAFNTGFFKHAVKANMPAQCCQYKYYPTCHCVKFSGGKNTILSRKAKNHL